jgi:hypothetical protein
MLLLLHLLLLVLVLHMALGPRVLLGDHLPRYIVLLLPAILLRRNIYYCTGNTVIIGGVITGALGGKLLYVDAPLYFNERFPN